MKKIYINPQLDVILANQSIILAGSEKVPVSEKVTKEQYAKKHHFEDDEEDIEFNDTIFNNTIFQ